jgi:hypothetical protein
MLCWLIKLCIWVEYERILYTSRLCSNFETNPAATAIVTSSQEGVVKAPRIAERIRAARYVINSQVNQFERRIKSPSAGWIVKKTSFSVTISYPVTIHGMLFLARFKDM